MKKLILLMVGLSLALPSGALAIQKFQRTGEIKTDEAGGYSETQKNYHERRSKQIKEKTGAGYYNGNYHSTSPEYRPGEWQFVEPSKGGHSRPKTYKKVKESDAKKKQPQKKTTKQASEKKETKAPETKTTKKVVDEQ
jgi:hypothetical protein